MTPDYDKLAEQIHSYFCMVCGERRQLMPVVRQADVHAEMWWQCRDLEACRLRAGLPADMMSP